MPKQPNESIQDYAQRLDVDLEQQPVVTLLELIEEVRLMKLVLGKLIKTQNPTTIIRPNLRFKERE